MFGSICAAQVFSFILCNYKHEPVGVVFIGQSAGGFMRYKDEQQKELEIFTTGKIFTDIISEIWFPMLLVSS